MSHAIALRGLEFLHEIRSHQLGINSQSVETQNGTVSATLTPSGTIKLEVFDRTGQGYASIHLTERGLDELIAKLGSLFKGHGAANVQTATS